MPLKNVLLCANHARAEDLKNVSSFKCSFAWSNTSL